MKTKNIPVYKYGNKIRRNIISLFLLTIVLFASAFTFVNSVLWKVKEDAYAVTFSGGSVDGAFKGLKANIDFDEANLSASKISATIDASTVKTGNSLRDKHARQGLDAEKYPTIKLESTSITNKGANAYEAKGRLTLKDVTKEIVLPFTFRNNVFSGKFSIITEEYNIDKFGTPDKVEITLKVPVTKG